MAALAAFAALLTGLGIVQCLVGLVCVFRFAARPLHAPTARPPVTILKPLCGDEAGLEEALAACCLQTYPTFQIVFGVHSADDTALEVVHRIQRRFPEHDIDVSIDATLYGPNRKVSNLINMLRLARHDLLVMSDSDLLVAPDYVERLVAALEQPAIGLVTAPCVGRPARSNWPTRLGASHLSHSFLPAILLSRALGRQDCLGTTVALWRSTLDRIGGLGAVTQYLAEDNMLGQRVQALGLGVGLADTVPAALVPEPRMVELWQHELRWARTIRALAPLGHAASCLQYPLFWALLAVAAAGARPWSLALLAAAWGARALGCWGVGVALSRRAAEPVTPPPYALLPLRDLVSVLEIGTSFFGDEVVWRGHKLCPKVMHFNELPNQHSGNTQR